MPALLLKVLKGILLKLASEAFLEWLFFWAADLLVESTKTKRDDKFLAKVKEACGVEDDDETS